VPLLGRASAVSTNNLEKVRNTIGADKLATLLNAAVTGSQLGVVATVSPDRLFAGLLDLLPPPHRSAFSFTTGLKVSPRRPFQLMFLPNDAGEQRRAARQLGLTVLDLTEEPPAKFAPDRGWPLLMHDLLEQSQFTTIASAVSRLSETSEGNLHALAEQLQYDLDRKKSLVDSFTPFAR
jgi:hypothetical protein